MRKVRDTIYIYIYIYTHKHIYIYIYIYIYSKIEGKGRDTPSLLAMKIDETSVNGLCKGVKYISLFENLPVLLHRYIFAQSARAVEYTDCFSAEG